MDAVRSFLLDSFHVTPLLLLFAMFFLGVLTSNIGMLLTGVGAAWMAPTLHTLATRFATPVTSFKDGSMPWYMYIFYVGAPFALLRPLIDFMRKLGAGGQLEYLNILSLFFIVGPVITEAAGFKIPPLQFLNPLRWGSMPATPLSGGDARMCSLLPPRPSDLVYSSPSLWTTMYVFLFGLLMSNAVELYRLPNPTLATVPSANLKEALDKQEDTRKQIATGSIALLVLITCGILYYRMSVVGCDTWVDIPFFALVAVFGAAWYSLLTEQCGIRAADLFGIVSTYVPPSVLQKPIVCTT